MSTKEYFYSFSSILLEISAFLLGFRSTIGQSYFGNSILLKLVTLIVWGSILFTCFLDSYKFSDFIKILFLFALGYLIQKTSGVESVIYNFLFLIAVKNHELNPILKANFWGILLAFLLVAFSSQLGIINNRIMDGGMSLGFTNPNCVSNFAAILLINYALRDYYKIKMHNIVSIFFIALLVYVICKSRTGLMLNLILVLGLFLFKTVRPSKTLFKRMIFIFCFLALFLGLVGVFLCNIVPFFTKMNEVFSGRYAQAQLLLLKYGVRPFGSFIEELDDAGRAKLIESMGASNVPLCDNGYARLLIQYGIVYLVFYIFAFWKTIGYFRKNNQFNYLLPLLLVLVATISETFWLSVNYCILYLCLSKWIFKKEKKSHKNKFLSTCFRTN